MFYENKARQLTQTLKLLCTVPSRCFTTYVVYWADINERTVNELWWCTVRRSCDASLGLSRRLRRQDSQGRPLRPCYVTPSCRHTASSCWTEGRNSRRPVSPGGPRRASCSDHPPRRSCRVPWQYTYTSTFSQRHNNCLLSFGVAGPRISNSLPRGLRTLDISYKHFKTLLKTYMFRPGHCALWHSIQAPYSYLSYLFYYLACSCQAKDKQEGNSMKPVHEPLPCGCFYRASACQDMQSAIVVK